MENYTTNSKAVVHDVPPYLKVYDDGTIERFQGTGVSPPGLDHATGVLSKDVVIQPDTGVSARLYLPANNLPPGKKLPLVIFFHGGAFLISSTADPLYHNMLNLLVRQSRALLVSVDYRRAPEHPLPAAYDDSWAALQWVSSAGAAEPWLSQYADFDRVFLAGDSAGANISHHMSIRVGSGSDPGISSSDVKGPDPGLGGLRIRGIVMVQPYFWGEEPIGVEAESPVFKAVVDNWWRFVCVSGKGCDDPLINPFADGAPGLERLGCERVLVCVAGNDVLRERGKLYFQKLVKCGKLRGTGVEFFESEGEGHVFHLIDPTSENSTSLINRFAQFINSE